MLTPLSLSVNEVIDFLFGKLTTNALIFSQQRELIVF